MKRVGLAVAASALVAVLGSAAFAQMHPPKKTAEPPPTEQPAAEAPAAETSAADAPAEVVVASILEGVSTEDQVNRGKAVYSASCANCHGSRLRGSPGGPGVAGPDFEETWVGASVYDLFTFVKTQMPKARPATLSSKKYIDVVAYILNRNGFPAGETELSVDDEATLQAIVIEEPPAQ
jgi:mono/diheme cytochrome c family protein